MTAIEIAGKSYQPNEIIEQAKKARGWFAAIAAFSFINSLLIMFGAEVSFVIGLGVTQVVDAVVMAIREEVGVASASALSVVGMGINLCILGVVMVIWWFCGKGSRPAYIIGMVILIFFPELTTFLPDWLYGEAK